MGAGSPPPGSLCPRGPPLIGSGDPGALPFPRPGAVIGRALPGTEAATLQHMAAAEESGRPGEAQAPGGGGGAALALEELLPFLRAESRPELRREAARGHHEWLLSDQVDLLPSLLLPLAGPEEFPEDEMEKLPLDLQYLPPEKGREPDPEIRKLLLEALLLLTATKPGRLLVRERGTYFILRELHKWEADPGVLAACEKLIQVLIGDEPEPGMENLLEVEIPAEVEEQLQRLDRGEEEEQQQREQPAPGSQSPQG
ncbi:PREDICTED: protein HGH1 homolog [Gekko japonicus]|uniref:Protein HGH1 homolog n=1 Tax=Gekko japonicus TaxID=146911 RepID=A0ABM1KJU9_GEKJA|nr:PREDICTED: protein HGH1 homolog [Gekko japonicus]